MLPQIAIRWSVIDGASRHRASPGPAGYLRHSSADSGVPAYVPQGSFSFRHSSSFRRISRRGVELYLTKGITHDNESNHDDGSTDGRKRMGAARCVGGVEREQADDKNREEESNMTNEKVIMLIEAKIQPQRRTELVEAAREYLPLVRAEPGVEAFYLTTRKDDPNTFVFYEIYRSQTAQDFHLQQDFTKKFLATLKTAQVGDRVRTSLVELATEGQMHSN
jgi:quinol monooxygenase YgiN